MRSPSLRGSMRVLVTCLALTLCATARADWPSDPTVNVPVCIMPNVQSSQRVVPDLSGGALIAWEDLRNGTDRDIYAHHVLANGAVDPSWPVNGRVICIATGSQTSVAAVSDGMGGAILAWSDARAGSALDIYAHHLQADGSLDPAWPASGLAVCTAPGIQTAVQMASDAAGGAVLIWRDRRNDSDVFAARVFANGQLDPAWQENGLAIASGTGSQELFILSVAGDGAGGCLVAWRDTRNGPLPDIYAQRILPNGALAAGWPSNGLAICTAMETQEAPSVAADGAGGMFVVWEDLRGGISRDIYAQHVRANGTLAPSWPAEGRAVCTAAGNQTRGKVVRDTAGGAFVAWTDARAGALPALYSQHLLANGTLDPAWPAADLAHCFVPGNHGNQVLLPDGYGGALAVWDDGRNETLDVYAQHLLVTGGVDPAWPASGVSVSTAAGNQNAIAAAIQDGSGGLIVAWSDSRSISTNDIYAQRVRADGTLGGTVVDVPRTSAGSLALGPLTPTPSRSGRLGLRFALPSEGDVFAELLDVAGRRVASRELGRLPAGPHASDWLLGAPMAPGAYLVRLRFGSIVRTMRAVTLE